MNRGVTMWVLCAAAVCVVPGAVRAQSPKPIKIAVPDLKVAGTVDKTRVEGLSALISSEAESFPNVQVIASSDIQAMLGFEAEKQLLSCADDTSCIADIGGALGVDYLLTSQVSKVGTTFIVYLVLLDVAAARPKGRLTRRAKTEDELVDLTISGVRDLLKGADLGAARGGEVVADTRLETDATEAGGTEDGGDDDATEEVFVSELEPAPAEADPGGGWGVANWTLLSAGVVGLGVGGVFYGTSWGVHGAYQKGQDGSVTPTVTATEARNAVRDAGIGLASLGVGAALVATAFLLGGDDAPAQDPGLVLGLGPNGAYVGVAGRWEP